MPPEEWTPLAVGFWTDPKVLGSTPACKLVVLASYTHAQEHLTDGMIRTPELALIAAKAGVAATRKVIDEIEARGLWEPCEGGWRIPKWGDWNKPAAVVRAAKDAKRRAGVLGNHKRWHVGEGVKVLGCELCYPPTSAIAPAIAQPIAPAIAQPIASGSQNRSQIDRHRTHTDTDTQWLASVAGDPQPVNDEVAQRIEADHPTAQAALADMRAAVDRAINGNEPGDVIEGPWPL